jgi:hypothetical protein
MKQAYIQTIIAFFGGQPWVVPVLNALVDMAEGGNIVLHEENRRKLQKKLKIGPNALRQALHQLTELGLLARPTLNFYQLHDGLLAPLKGDEEEITFLVKIDASGEHHLRLISQEVPI